MWKKLCSSEIDERFKMCRILCTDSVHLQPQGYIFQYGFLGEVQFKKSIKKGLFDEKMGFYSQKTQKILKMG